MRIEIGNVSVEYDREEASDETRALVDRLLVIEERRVDIAAARARQTIDRSDAADAQLSAIVHEVIRHLGPLLGKKTPSQPG
jgi:hypothetical protein